MARLLVERTGDVAVLTLDNPDKRNALDHALCAELGAALAGLAPGGVRAAVVTGAGERAFSAGFDLDALDDGAAAERAFTGLIEAVVACPVPLVAALNGAAFGGGCELALTCDVRVGHAGVKLAMPPARLGIVYPTRGLARLSALCGESRARQMLLFARAVAADEAHRIGLLDHLVDAADVRVEALALAQSAAELAPLAVQGMRRAFELLLARRAALGTEDAAELERLRLAAWSSEDAAEARAAHRAKRAPAFRGG